MRVSIIAIGRMKSGPETELAARYSKRFEGTGRSIGLAGIDVTDDEGIGDWVGPPHLHLLTYWVSFLTPPIYVV